MNITVISSYNRFFCVVVFVLNLKLKHNLK